MQEEDKVIWELVRASVSQSLLLDIETIFWEFDHTFDYEFIDYVFGTFIERDDLEVIGGYWLDEKVGCLELSEGQYLMFYYE